MIRTSCLEKLASVITSIQLAHPIRVAIDGVDGVGKTTLANELVALIQKTGPHVIRASIDDFHNPRIVRYARGDDSDEGYYLDTFNFLQRPELEDLWDLTIWVGAPFDLTIERAIKRDSRDGSDIETIRRKYEQRYVPGQKLYLEQCRPNERADIFFDNSIFEHPTMRLNNRD